jgi:hypothetical protein
MSNVTQNESKLVRSTPEGIISASLLVVVLVATLGGAVTGLTVGDAVSPVALAVLSGLIGTLAAGVVRNTLLISAWGVAGVEDVGTPLVVLAYGAVASLAGSLSAFQLMMAANAPIWPALTGALAGLLSAGLMGLLIVTYRMQPRRQD